MSKTGKQFNEWRNVFKEMLFLSPVTETERDHKMAVGINFLPFELIQN